MKTLVAFVGPSGAGKTFLMREMQKRYGWNEIVSTTDRSPRPGEIDGETYHFVSEEMMDALANDGSLMEQVEFSGHRYAIQSWAFEEAVAANGIAATIVIPDGLKQIEEWNKRNGNPYRVVSVYIDGDPIELTSRMLKRIEDAINEGSYDRSVYARRIVGQATELQWGADHEYTLKFAESTEDTIDDIISRIVQEVQ